MRVGVGVSTMFSITSDRRNNKNKRIKEQKKGEKRKEKTAVQNMKGGGAGREGREHGFKLF